MHQRFLTFVLTTALLGWAGAVQADPVIYDNGVTPGLFSVASQISAAGNISSADDFMLPVGPGWRVTDVHWTGVDNTLGDILDFRISFYADDGGTPTGGGLTDPADSAIAVRTLTASSSPTADMGDAENRFDYWADISPVILDGGTQYWVAIEGIIGDDLELQWFWTTNANDNTTTGGNAMIHDGDWVTPFAVVIGDYELVFSLTGTQIPAPGAVVLAMLGLPAIGWVKRRFA